jgi:hypothetical protein
LKVFLFTSEALPKYVVRSKFDIVIGDERFQKRMHVLDKVESTVTGACHPKFDLDVI